MSYVQAVPKFEAAQFAVDDFAAFQTLVDPAGTHNVTLNDDGTCSYFAAGVFVLNPGDWLITNAYFGMFAGWDNNPASMSLADADFQAQFVTQ